MDANEHKYYYFNLCLFVFIRGFPYPLYYFLFTIFRKEPLFQLLCVFAGGSKSNIKMNCRMKGQQIS
jgi:hypothetical protein